MAHRQTASVTVTVLDVNDITPMCSMSVYNIQISENIPVRSQVLTIEAFDDDSGENSELEFSITGGDIGVFQIDGR